MNPLFIHKQHKYLECTTTPMTQKTCTLCIVA